MASQQNRDGMNCTGLSTPKLVDQSGRCRYFILFPKSGLYAIIFVLFCCVEQNVNCYEHICKFYPMLKPFGGGAL